MSNSAWHGYIDLQFNQSTTGRTILTRSYARAPLKVQRPFYPEPEVCHTVLLHSAGGMVGGDRLSSQIDLAPQSRALITTAAAAKIYRSTGGTAHQQIKIHIGANACLEWLPQETILFNQAKYQQDLHVDLDPGGIFCTWEIVRLGRSASQEIFQQGCWQNALEVWQAGKPLWIDRQRLTGEQWSSPQAAAAQPILGLFAIVGQSIAPDTVDKARALGPESSSGSQWGATALQSGLVCRYRGSDRQAAQRWFMALWDLLRQQYLGRAACLPRVWQR